MFCKNGVLKDFAKFTEKHPCRSLFFNKVAGLRPANVLKKRLQHMCFSVNFVKFLRTLFLKELLLSIFIEYISLILLAITQEPMTIT